MTAFSDLVESLKKPRPKLLGKRDAKAKAEAEDRRQRAICKARSGGQCEVKEVRFRPESSAIYTKRCARRSSQNHHLLGGIGRRNKGRSLLAAHRIDVCDRCHAEITNHVLKPVNQTLGEDAETVRYERVA